MIKKELLNQILQYKLLKILLKIKTANPMTQLNKFRWAILYCNSLYWEQIQGTLYIRSSSIFCFFSNLLKPVTNIIHLDPRTVSPRTLEQQNLKFSAIQTRKLWLGRSRNEFWFSWPSLLFFCSDFPHTRSKNSIWTAHRSVTQQREPAKLLRVCSRHVDKGKSTASSISTAKFDISLNIRN